MLYLRDEVVPVRDRDGPEVGVPEHAVHDPHDGLQDSGLFLEGQHQEGHVGCGLVVHDEQAAVPRERTHVIADLNDCKEKCFKSLVLITGMSVQKYQKRRNLKKTC